MGEASPALPIHSLAEAYLYLMVTPCDGCKTGPLAADEARVQHDADARILTIPVKCRKCGRGADITFDTTDVEPGGFAARTPGSVARVNPTDEPSRIIDLAGWVTLFAVIADTAGKTDAPPEALHLKMEAAQCLDEALKFYEDDNDLPPSEAFFRESSRRQFSEHPATFSRQRLIELRARMPTLRPTGRGTVSGDPPRRKRRRWWPWARP